MNHSAVYFQHHRFDHTLPWKQYLHMNRGFLYICTAWSSMKLSKLQICIEETKFIICLLVDFRSILFTHTHTHTHLYMYTRHFRLLVSKHLKLFKVIYFKQISKRVGKTCETIVEKRKNKKWIGMQMLCCVECRRWLIYSCQSQYLETMNDGG